jgi:hypothetical protein
MLLAACCVLRIGNLWLHLLQLRLLLLAAGTTVAAVAAVATNGTIATVAAVGTVAAVAQLYGSSRLLLLGMRSFSVASALVLDILER